MLGIAALLAGLVAVIVLTSGDGGGGSGAAPAGETAAEQPRGERESGSGGGGGSGSDGEAPEAAVQGFYELAASDDFAGATALASDNLETQLGGPEGIADTLSTLESIEFTKLRTVSSSGATAVVELATVATHTTYTDSCSGTASVINEAGEWLVDRLNIDCG